MKTTTGTASDPPFEEIRFLLSTPEGKEVPVDLEDCSQHGDISIRRQETLSSNSRWSKFLYALSRLSLDCGLFFTGGAFGTLTGYITLPWQDGYPPPRPEHSFRGYICARYDTSTAPRDFTIFLALSTMAYVTSYFLWRSYRYVTYGGRTCHRELEQRWTWKDLRRKYGFRLELGLRILGIVYAAELLLFFTLNCARGPLSEVALGGRASAT